MKAAAYLLSNERQATQQTAPENMMSYGCENLNTIIKSKYTNTNAWFVLFVKHSN